MGQALIGFFGYQGRKASLRAPFFFAALFVSFFASPCARADQADGAELKTLRETAPQTFLQIVLERASTGDVAAEMVAADAYENGKYGAPQDDARALDWYRKAAETHNGDAELAVARFYQAGKGVARNVSDANAWLERSVNDGNARALDFLGDSYLTGRGIPEDDQKAIGLYKQAAKRDVVASEVKLGGLYFQGQGLQQSYGAAYYWFRIAQTNPQSSEYPELDTAVQKAAIMLDPQQRQSIDAQVQAVLAKLRPQACPTCITLKGVR